MTIDGSDIVALNSATNAKTQGLKCDTPTRERCEQEGTLNLLSLPQFHHVKSQNPHIRLWHSWQFFCLLSFESLSESRHYHRRTSAISPIDGRQCWYVEHSLKRPVLNTNEHDANKKSRHSLQCRRHHQMGGPRAPNPRSEYERIRHAIRPKRREPYRYTQSHWSDGYASSDI